MFFWYFRNVVHVGKNSFVGNVVVYSHYSIVHRSTIHTSHVILITGNVTSVLYFSCLIGKSTANDLWLWLSASSFVYVWPLSDFMSMYCFDWLIIDLWPRLCTCFLIVGGLPSLPLMIISHTDNHHSLCLSLVLQIPAAVTT